METTLLDVNNSSAAMCLNNILSCAGRGFYADHSGYEKIIDDIMRLIVDHKRMIEKNKERIKRLRFLLGKK